MASHLFSRTDSVVPSLQRRRRLRRVLLESLERRDLMAVDMLSVSQFGEPVSYSVAGQSNQPLVFSTTDALQGLSVEQMTAYLDDAFEVTNSSDLASRSWFPLVQQRYEQWSQQNGLAFTQTVGLTAEGEGDGFDQLIGEGEAGGPRLLSIAPNSGDIFSFNNVNNLSSAPTELIFRFDGANGILQSTIANGFKLVRAGRDGTFGNGNDISITPGFLNFGDNNRIIIMRFSSPLPDDLYRVSVIGVDNAAANETAVRSTGTPSRTLDARLVDSTPGDFTRDSVDFKVELGAQVVSVVPQPVDRLASNTVNLTQSGGTFTLRAHQGDTTDNVAGTTVSLRLAQAAATATTNTATYDKATNRITVNLLAGATVANVAAAINTLGPNFSATGVVNGAAPVNALDIGIRTVSLSNWTLDPKRDQIRVYFNDDDFYATAVKTGDVSPNPSIVDPAFYQLILTRDTVQPGDDVLIPASEVQSITYDPALNLATITYNQPIDQLAGAGTYRLRIGGRDAVANQAAPQTITPTNIAVDPAGDFANAPTIGTLLTSTSMVINQEIITTSAADLPLSFPGSNFEPGHRDIQDESHIDGGDGSPQIATVAYNFALNRSYGLDAAGRPVSTTITPEQIARVREIFEFYSMQLGIDFVETESAGLTIVVGDLFPLGGTQSGPGDVAGIAGGGLAIMDGAEIWDNSFGAGFFSVAMHEIGHLLGLGHTYDLPPGTIMGSEGDLSSNPTLPSEWVFPGDADIVHGQFLFRPDNRDVDSYKFIVPAGSSGTFTAETFAERLENSSNLDTYLTLLRQTANGYEVVAVNNDNNSSDSFLSVNLTEGTYFLSVTGKGNENFNPLIQNTGDGAVSQGDYRLKINFVNDIQTTTITDLSGTKLDGDGDGQAGGNFNFWFRAAPPADLAPVGTPKTIYVDKGYAGPTFTGSAASPMNSLDLNNPVKWPVGFVQPNDIIRVVGSQGADRLLTTSADNPAYEVGRGGVGNVVLSDGLTLEVPQGVTMMIDAGAIFKLRNTRIATGSLDSGINKSFSSLQVLGTPRQTANFTSYNDQSQGIDTNPIVTSPQQGDWGGLDFHNDIDRQEGRGDYERKGIFLNHVAFADIRYGGGQITVVSPSPTINPINLNQARPTLLNNIITFSADAAISADPDSFEETRFTEPRYQIAQSFNPDYDRVGPVIRGNTLTRNTTNGLFVRTATFAGGPLTELTTSARWDDTDITYVIGENLIIAGTPGGAFRETTAPDVSLVQNFDATGGSLVVGQTVSYKVDFIDKFGGVSIPSVATTAKTLTSNALRLTNLPTAPRDFVGRRLFRSNDGGVTFRLIAELDGDTTTYTDVGGDLAAVLANPNATSLQRARPDARLQVDPGVVVKLSGARIEVAIGAQLIAEGSSDRKVVFTSRADDRFGAAGTFDTNGNGNSTNAITGDWGGLVARHLSSISIDNAYIAFGGGVTSVSGGFAGFNAIEIQQADGRVTNSVIENNGSGLGGNLFTRDGRGPHDASVIFVAGSQPVIGNNIIRNNAISNTAVISINANAMNTDNVQDRGRQTGYVESIGSGLGNSGPLVSGNLLLGNGLNGMRVRGQTQTTATVWDDADIVHILQSEIVVPDLHTYGGLRLQSKVDESLVVKLGTGAGITALGRPLDITDRIGGSVQILGTPGFPVVMTSLSDDSVGAGFDPNGRELVDTNNNGTATSANAGDWRSIRFEPYTNDRNLDTIVELEADQIQDVGINDLTTTAQQIGALAGALNGGDENLRLGFTLHGTIAAPQDLDVYSFIGIAGTTVWLDIDQTNGSLDSVVELLDSSGRIIAQSNNSIQESANPSLLFVTSDTSKITRDRVNPLEVDPFITTRDLYTVNPLDAGFRLLLPGTVGGANTYYVRVRSSNLKPGDASTNLQNPALDRAGLSSGAYRLQIRMRQNDETAGSTVRYADIRFATNGIEVNGMPGHSPLLGQVAEQGDAVNNPSAAGTGINNLPGFGNILNSDRGSVSLAGSLGAANDVDLYNFVVNRDSTQSIPSFGSANHLSTILDLDYADGLGRADATLWVYRIVNNAPVLVLVGTDSNIADDRAAPGQGSDLDALSRGSVGSRDPFIGAAELPSGTYVVAVSNNSQMAAAMQQFQTANPINPLIRLEPVNSVNRLFVDRIGTSSPDTAAGTTPVLFTTSATNGGLSPNNAVGWTLADITGYFVRDFNTGSQLVFGNAYTGVQEAEVSNPPRVNDAKMSPDGRLVGYQIVTTAAQTDANSGVFIQLNSIGDVGANPTPTAVTNLGNSGIQTFTAQQTGATSFAIQQRDLTGPGDGNTPQGDGMQFTAISMFTETDTTNTLQMFGVASRGNNRAFYNRALLDANNAVVGVGAAVFETTNFIYKLDPVTGAAINPNGFADRTGNALTNSGGAATNKIEFGRFLSNGTVTGLAEIGSLLFAVSDQGELFRVFAGDGTFFLGNIAPLTTVTDNAGAPIVFTGLTAGPRNLENGRFANMLFGTTADGTIWAFDTAGIKQPVFPGFSPSVRSNSRPLGNTVSSIDFSPLDVNLWHTTDTRDPDAGHGRTIPYDRSQLINLEGDNSLYFGFENGNRAPNNRQAGTWQGVYNVAAYQGNYNLPGGAHGAIVSNPIDLRAYSSDDLPTMYFNYFLSTEGANSDLADSDIRMRDALRVYAAAEDGSWILLSTNNSDIDGPDRLAAADEFDTLINRNVDRFGNPLFTQELYDNTGTWRQARVSLSPFAGLQNVRLRFEFSTGATFRTGDPLLGGVELVAVAGSKLNDAETFTVTPQDGVSAIGPQRFELDLGLVLNLPGGASITDGVSQLIINGTPITFSTTSDTGNNIQYTLTDSPVQIANKVRTRLPQILGISPSQITVNSERPNVLNIANAAAVASTAELDPNSTLATAQSIDGANWSLASDANISNSTTRPHITIDGTGDGTFDYYTFTVPTAGAVGDFDIDFGSFDTELFLFDSAGNLLTNNDDIVVLDAGSTSFLDSRITFTFPTAGVFTIGVGRFDSVGNTGGITGNTPEFGDQYQLHISIDGKTASPVVNIVSGAIAGLPAAVIAGLPGVAAGNVSVPISQAMTDIQVRDAIRARLAATFNAPTSTATANAGALQAWPVINSTLRLFKYTVTESSGLGLTTTRPGDQFGVQGSNGNRMDERAQNNGFEGVYIDDIIIGLAERGEMVFNATTADALAGFSANTNYSGRADTFNIFQVEQGPYQLTIRSGAEYGITDRLTGDLALARSYDSNARLAKQVSIQVAATSAGQFRDGMTFTLTDGTNVAQYEFDVTMNATDVSTGVASGNIPVRIAPNATAIEIARAIRDAINSPTSQLVLKISAGIQGEMIGSSTPTSSPLVLLHGLVSTSLSAGLSIAGIPALSIIQSGTDTVFGEDLGDVEREREQGQILLVGNTITNSSNFGINNDAGARNQSAIGGQVGNRPYPGAPINLPTQNTRGLAPGVVIVNNILANNTLGGIRISGDEGNTGMQVPSLIARVSNNTIFGGTDGIFIDGGASPTILNNILANTVTGIRNASGTGVVLGANLYQGNTTNTIGTGGDGAFAQPLAAGAPLFVSTTNRRFYLAAGSLAIDSSLEALQERAELTQVKNQIGLPLSPMLAPDLDVTGQRRVDDPTVNSPAGLGGNVFKDRGAVDRSDFIGLNAIILQPQDNDSGFADIDRNTTFIQLTEGELGFFSILLQDTNGTGPDETSVRAPGAVMLTENGRLLQPDIDYVFGYNANSRTIQLTPIAGIWRKDSVYEISLNNRTGIRLTVGAGNAIADGARYTINFPGGPRVFEFDKSPAGVSSGAIPVRIQDSFTPYQVAAALSAAITGANLGLINYLLGDGNLMVVGASSITASTGLSAPLTIDGIRDLARNLLFPNRENSLTQFTIIMPEVKLDFGDVNGANAPTIKAPNSNVVPLLTNGNGARHALLPIDVPLLALGRFADPDNDGTPSPGASADDTESMVNLGTLGSQSGATLGIRGSATIAISGLPTDGQQFTITDTLAYPLAPVVFEFNTDGTPSSTSVFSIPVAALDTPATVADRVAAVIVDAAKRGRLDALIAVVDPANSARVRIIGNNGHLVDLTGAPAVSRLAVGDVDIVLSSSTANVANLDGRQFQITDGAGTTVNFELNNIDPLTPTTPIATGNVAIDVNLATATSDTIAAAIANAINGQIALRSLVLGGAVANASTVTIWGDDEEGVTFKGNFNAASNPVEITVTSTGAGVLDAWIDWNGDGDFSDNGEQIITASPVQPGANTFFRQTPASATIGFVTGRFRLSTLGAAVGGVAIGGEVEDYLIEVIEGAPPVAVNDNYTTNEYDGPTDLVNSPLVVNNVALGVLNNDTDPNNDPLAIPPIVEPIFVFDENPNTAAIDPLVNVSNGTLVLNANGTFTYTPNKDFNGRDTFVYNVVDVRLKSLTPATVTITVNPINDAPLGLDDTIAALEDEVIVRAGSTFTANDLAHFAITSTPSNADNEKNQVLTLVSAAIISDVTTNFGGIAGLGVNVAAKPGQGVYGIRVYVATSDLGAGVAPTVSVVNTTITVTLNSNAASVSTVNDFIAAIAGNAAANALVNITITSGSGSTAIGSGATAYSPLVVPPSGGTFSVANNQLTYTPPANYNSRIGGPAILQLTIADDAAAGPVANLQTSSRLTINIAPVNDAPQFDWTDPKIDNTIEDGGLVTVPNFITNIKPGPDTAVDEGIGPTLFPPENQQVSFDPPLIRALDPSLFAVQPRISPTGTLTYQLAPDVNKITPFPQILVAVAAADTGLSGGAEGNVNTTITRTFTIIPEAVNDAPEFTLPATTTSLEDNGIVVLRNFVTGIRKGPTTALDETVQTLSVVITADPTAFTATGYPTLNLATGDITYETAPHVNQFTGQNFNVGVTIIDDGGIALGGVDRTTKSFSITVTELNDPPEYTMPTFTSAFVEDPLASPPTTVVGFVTGIQPGPLAAIDEGPVRENQRVSFLVRALDPTLFDPAFLPAISDTGTLTYRLKQDINQIVPFPRVLVEVIAVDTGLNDAGNAVPRNINAAAPRTFTILPDPINDAPEFTIPATTNSNEDQGVVTVADFVTGARPGPITALDELAAQTMTITLEALNPSSFTATGQPRVVLDPTTGRGVLTYETNRDVNSLTQQDLRVRVILRDNGGTANAGDVDTTIKTFSITVREVNDAPSFTLPTPAEVTVDEDNESVTGLTPTSIPFATNIVAGPSTAVDETTIPATRQTVSFETVSVTNSSMFTVQPTLSPTGVLSFVTARDRNGQSVVVVRLRDSGLDATSGNGDVNVSSEQTFTINIRPINDPPVFDLQPTATSREDQGLVTIPNFATNILPGPTTAVDEQSQLFTIRVRALDPLAFRTQPAIAADGTLTFATAADVNSSMTNRDLRVEVFIEDNGTASPLPHNNTTDRRTFTIITTPVNDAPSFTLPETQVTVREDEEQVTGITPFQKPGFATDILRGPLTAVDELNQVLTFQILSVSSPELFAIQPAISDTGVLSFRTAANKNGKALVVVQLFDSGASSPLPNDNDSNRQTFTISITPINDAPQFDIPGSITVAEDDGLISQNGFATNVRRGPVGADDENSQEIEFLVTALNPSSFSVQPTIGPDGTLTFRTALNVNIANADLRVAVQLRDNGVAAPSPNSNLSTVKTFTVNATPVNDPPIPDFYSAQTDEESRLTILSSDVLIGDQAGPTPDELGQVMTITQVQRTSEKGGIVVPIFNGNDIVSFDYFAPANIVGTDTFLYVVTDQGVPQRSGTGTITISIKGINDAPQFVKGGDQTVPEDAPLVTVTGWATDILPGPAVATDELSQVVTFTATADKPNLFEVAPAVSSNGTLTFKPAADANGVAIVRVFARDDGSGVAPNVNQSAEQVFTITITPVNDAPVFTAGSNVSVLEDSGAYAQPWATDIAPAAGLLATPQRATDEAGQLVDFGVVVDRPSLFSVQPTISSTGQLRFTPNANAFGTAILTVRATDRGPAGALDQNTSTPRTLTVTITPTNDAPVAVSDTFNASENAVLNLAAPGVLQNDTDVDLPNDTLRAVARTLTTARGATVTINADGSIRYDALNVDAIQQMTTGQSIQDTFVYQVQDSSQATSADGTITINVTGVNDAPIARDDRFSIGVGQTRLLDVLTNDTDIDTQINPTTINVSALPAFGTVTVNQTGVIQYVPGGGFRGTDVFRYTVRDAEGNLSNEAIVTVVVNNAPTASDDSATTFKNQAVTINVLANDSDQDGTLDPGSVTIAISPSPNGTAVVQPDGRIVFTPATDFAGIATFSYTVNDNLGTSSSVANVSVRVLNSRWQNPRLNLDVSADTFISPIDALLVISYLNSGAPRDLRTTTVVPPPFLDVNGDEFVSPVDALLIIDFLNKNRGAAGNGEGEGESNAANVNYAMMVTPLQMLQTVGPQLIAETQAVADSILLEASQAVGQEPVVSQASRSFAAWFDEDEDEDSLVDELSCSATEADPHLNDSFFEGLS